MNKKTKKCDKCGKNISTNNYEKHVISCNPETDNVEKQWFKNENSEYECKICHKVFNVNGIGNHVKYHFGYKNPNLGKIGWSKGLTKESSESLRKQGETLKQHIKEGTVIPYFKGKKHSEETRRKWKLNPNMGGIRKGSGRGIKGIYQGYYCDSTWELAWLIYQLDHNKTPIRNTESFIYAFNNEIHKYYPDFIMDNIYYEIKGQKGDSWEAKLKSFPIDKKLIVLDKTNIKEYIIYAELKFGKDFWIIAYGDTINRRKDYKKIKTMNLCACGNEKWIKSKVCTSCAHKKMYKVDWDSIDLETLLKENNYNKVAVAKILGVSDNAVKKQYLKRYPEKEYPSRHR